MPKKVVPKRDVFCRPQLLYCAGTAIDQQTQQINCTRSYTGMIICGNRMIFTLRLLQLFLCGDFIPELYSSGIADCPEVDC